MAAVPISCSRSSSNQSFNDADHHALSRLEMSHLTLKDKQMEAISAVYSGNDVFVFLLTGFSKSICFQVLPFLFDHKMHQRSGQCCRLSASLLDGGPGPDSQEETDVEAVVISSSSRDNTLVDRECRATENRIAKASFFS